MKTLLANPRPVKLRARDDSRAVALAQNLGLPIGAVLRACVAAGISSIEKSGIRPKRDPLPGAAGQGEAR